MVTYYDFRITGDESITCIVLYYGYSAKTGNVECLKVSKLYKIGINAGKSLLDPRDGLEEIKPTAALLSKFDCRNRLRDTTGRKPFMRGSNVQHQPVTKNTRQRDGEDGGKAKERLSTKN